MMFYKTTNILLLPKVDFSKKKIFPYKCFVYIIKSKGFCGAATSIVKACFAANLEH